MKKVLKIVGAVIVVMALVVLASSFLLHVLLPPEKAKALVLKQLTGHLKREVQIGDVSVSLLSGLVVSDLKISEAPDFARGTFISSDHFSIRLALIPLIFREVVVRQLILRHPVITIVRNPDGKTFNFSDLLTPPAPPAKSGSTAAGEAPVGVFDLPEAYAASPAEMKAIDSEPPFKLVISHAQIDHGVVHFIDKSPAQQSVDIDPLDLKLGNVSMTSPFSVQADLQAKARNVAATLKVSGETDLKTASFKVKNCELSSGGSTLTLMGKASQLKSNRPSVDLKLDIKEFKLATLAPFVPLPSNFKLEGPIVGNARIKGDQQKMIFSTQVDLEKVQVKVANQFSKPTRVPMGFSAKGDILNLQDVDLSELKIVLGSMQWRSHGKILAIRSAQPQVSLHLESNSFPVMEPVGFVSLGLPKNLVLKGHAQLAADLSGTTTSSRFAAKCESNDLGIAWGNQFVKPAGTPFRVSLVGELIQPPARTVSAKKATSASLQTVNVQNVTASLGTLVLEGNGSAVLGGSTPRFQMNFKSNTFSLKELSNFAPFLATYRLAGSASTELRASGTSQSPLVNGSLNLANASLHYEQSDLTQITTALTYTLQDVSIPKLTAKLNGSDVLLKLVGHRLTTQPDINVDATISELDLAKLLPPPPPSSPSAAVGDPSVTSFMDSPPKTAGNDEGIAWAAPPPAVLPPMKLSGHLSVGHVRHEFYDAKNLDFKWDLNEVTPDLSRINGTAELKQGPGVLKNMEKLVAQSKTARLALLPITTLQKMDKLGILKNFGLPSLQTITFSGIQGDYEFRAGVMDIKTFELLSQQMNVNTQGTIGLAGTQPLNLRVKTQLAAGVIRGTVGQILSDEGGRTTLNFVATGTVPDPQVKLAMQEAGRKAVQQLGKELLKGLGGGGNSQKAPSSAPTDNSPQSQPTQPPQGTPPPQPNPVDDIQKALKNIFH